MPGAGAGAVQCSAVRCSTEEMGCMDEVQVDVSPVAQVLLDHNAINKMVEGQVLPQPASVVRHGLGDVVTGEEGMVVMTGMMRFMVRDTTVMMMVIMGLVDEEDETSPDLWGQGL